MEVTRAGIVFRRTEEEKEFSRMKRELQEEKEEVAILKKELEESLKQVNKLLNKQKEG